jgi:PAS domain S-box-containing protein
MPHSRNTTTKVPAEHFTLFQGGGEMGALMRNFDWEAHPLGNPEQWPESLKMNIRLLLNSAFPMFIWWSKGLYAFHNDAYLPALGDKHPQALGERAKDVWSEIWETLQPIVENILNTGKPFYAEALPLTLERKGFLEETYWTFSYSPAFNDAGQIDGIFCACYEVTSTILNERRLKTLKDISGITLQIQTMNEASQSACSVLSENLQDIPFSMIYLLNGAGTETRLLGYAGDLPEEIALPAIDLSAPEPVWPLAHVKEKREFLVIQNPALPYWSTVSHSSIAPPNRVAILPVIRPGQNKIIGFFISGISNKLEYDANYQGFHKLLAGHIATSITSVQNREELALQKEYLNDIFQQAPVGITILRGPEYVIDLANPGVCEIWGRKQEEVLGKPVLEALPEVRDQGIKELLDGVSQTGVPYVANELPIILERNGAWETVYLNFVYHPLRNSKGLVTGVIAVAIDISEQVAARHKIEEMNKELLTTNADLDNFVYAASHDLKAPISNIEGLMQALIDFLPEETTSSETVDQVLRLIQTSVERFKRTVTDLTQVARIQREADEDIKHVDLSDVIAEVRLDFEPEIIASGAHLELDTDPDATIRFSAKNVRSVVYNLLSNALKYRSPDRVPQIKITTRHTPEHVLLSVADNGLGMATEDKGKIFSMFKRLHDHVEGSGIGLYIVKKIVENSGGRIEVDSQVNQGTTFQVYFKR